MPQDQGPIGEPQISREDQALRAHSFDDLLEATEGLDNQMKTFVGNAGYDLELLMRTWKGEDSWGELMGKKVLDLASGSALGKRQWQPFFARICANNGALVTAVDILPQAESDKKLLHEIKADLVPTVLKGKLAKVVGEGPFDVIHSYSFIGSNPCPDLSEALRKLEVPELVFTKSLLEQSFRILAESGIISFDERNANGNIYYTKKEGKLVRL